MHRAREEWRASDTTETLDGYEPTHKLSNPYETEAQRIVGFNHVLLYLL